MTETTKKPQKPNKALKRRASKIEALEAEFDERRATIESDETKTPAEKRDELLAAASELEWTIRAINERSTP
jgi:uncharacterized DUF497 family protein